MLDHSGYHGFFHWFQCCCCSRNAFLWPWIECALNQKLAITLFCTKTVVRFSNDQNGTDTWTESQKSSRLSSIAWRGGYTYIILSVLGMQTYVEHMRNKCDLRIFAHQTHIKHTTLHLWNVCNAYVKCMCCVYATHVQTYVNPMRNICELHVKD